MKFSNISTASKFILLWTPFLSFLVFNFFPLLFPELISNLDSNIWSATLIILIVLLKCWFKILFPGLWSLFMIHYFPPLKEIFLHECIDLQFNSLKHYFLYPVTIICFFFTISGYYFNVGGKSMLSLLIGLCFIFSSFIYYKQSQKQLPAYIDHKTFFLKKGASILLIVTLFYISISLTILALAALIQKCTIPFALINNSKPLELACFFALLVLFTFPSLFLTAAFTRSSKDRYIWFFNAIFLMLFIFFIYIEWRSPILKPKLQEHHYAFFNDVNYYFDKQSCAVLNQNGIKLKRLNKKLCTIDEEFETTSAIGKELILTFNNDKKITIPKPKYSSQSMNSYAKHDRHSH